MFIWLRKKKLKLNLNYKKNRKPWQNNDPFIKELLAPKNFFLIEPVICFFTEGEIIFNSFLEIGWSLEHHLFFLDYYRVLTYYIHFASGPLKGGGAQVILFSWFAAAQTICFSKQRVTINIFSEEPESNLYIPNKWHSENVVAERFLDLKNFEFFENSELFPDLGDDLAWDSLVAQFRYINKWSHFDSFYLSEHKNFLEHINFWFIWHTTIFILETTSDAFFAELRELEDEFLTELKPKYTSSQEDELSNSAELIFHDPEYRDFVVHKMRLWLQKNNLKSFINPLAPIYAFGDVVPSLDLYYLLVKGFEISHYLGELSWSLQKLSLFYYHVDLIDTFFLKLNSGVNAALWKKYASFNLHTEEKLSKLNYKRWAVIDWFFGARRFEISEYIKSKGWYAEPIYLTNKKEFITVIWSDEERFNFLGDKWHKLYYTLFEILDLEIDRPLLSASTALIYNFLGLGSIFTARYDDIVEKTKPKKKKASIELLLYNQKFIRRAFAEHKLRLQRARNLKKELINFLKIRVLGLHKNKKDLKHFYWYPASFNKFKRALSVVK